MFFWNSCTFGHPVVKSQWWCDKWRGFDVLHDFCSCCFLSLFILLAFKQLSQFLCHVIFLKYFSFFKKYLFIWPFWVLVVALRIFDFHCFLVACVIFGCSMWDLVPWPGIEPGPLALGEQSLSHQGSPMSFDIWGTGNWKIILHCEWNSWDQLKIYGFLFVILLFTFRNDIDFKQLYFPAYTCNFSDSLQLLSRYSRVQLCVTP